VPPPPEDVDGPDGVDDHGDGVDAGPLADGTFAAREPADGDLAADDLDTHDAELARQLDRASRRRRLLLAALGLVVVAALVASMVAVRSAGSDDDPAADLGDVPGSSDTGDAGSSPGAGEATDAEPASEAEITAAVAEISEFVAQERGLRFREPVDVELAGEGEFQERLLVDFDEDADDLRQTEVFLEGLGMVEPDVDLVEAMRSLLGGGVVGFYDPESAELVVRGAALTPYVRTTIAHELVHALDDQHFGLDRDEYDDADDEVSFGFTSITEGNARRIEQAYLQSLSDAEQEQANEEELALGGGIDTSAIPNVLIDLIGAPYTLGERLVGEIVADGGNEGLASAFADPPRTSEQVLAPQRYLAREPAIAVPGPQVDGEVVDEGTVGQLMVVLVLADAMDVDAAAAAASGWGGDRGVAWRDGSRSCVTATFVGDDADETTEMREAFEQWVGESGEAVDARVETVGRTDAAAPFSVRSCAV
jgi:hypothetical protein